MRRGGGMRRGGKRGGGLSVPAPPSCRGLRREARGRTGRPPCAGSERCCCHTGQEARGENTQREREGNEETDSSRKGLRPQDRGVHCTSPVLHPRQTETYSREGELPCATHSCGGCLWGVPVACRARGSWDPGSPDQQHPGLPPWLWKCPSPTGSSAHRTGIKHPAELLILGLCQHSVTPVKQHNQRLAILKGNYTLDHIYFSCEHVCMPNLS